MGTNADKATIMNISEDNELLQNKIGIMKVIALMYKKRSKETFIHVLGETIE